MMSCMQYCDNDHDYMYIQRLFFVDLCFLFYLPVLRRRVICQEGAVFHILHFVLGLCKDKKVSKAKLKP